jgi:hypothetical protein
VSYDVHCPYCNSGQEINHDDGYGYSEGCNHHQECGDCGKTFTYQTSISFYYEAEKADCLNGEPHNLEPVTHYPLVWPEWVRCKTCDYENRGKYQPSDTFTKP